MRISKNDFENFPRFSLIPKDNYVADSLCFFTSSSLLYLQGILNSEVAKYYFFNNIAILDNGGMQMRQQYVELVPIQQVIYQITDEISELVNHLNQNPNNKSVETELHRYVYKLYGFSDEEVVYIKTYLDEKKKDIES